MLYRQPWLVRDLQGSGATSIKLPAMGFPKPTSLANALMLKFETDVFGVTKVWVLKSAGCSKRRKT